MASASVAFDTDQIEDYEDEELALILQEVERFEREELAESDFAFGQDSGEEEGGQSDPEDDIPLAMLQQTWRPATQPTVRAFVQPTGPSHALPANAKPLDYFVLFLPQEFFVTAANETNRYAAQKMAAKGAQ